MSSKQQKKGQHSQRVRVAKGNVMRVPKTPRNQPRWVR
jgi:hypothetical protein